ncbi:hypothetical protein M0805_006755 [Coniferiporia weirii]|nr:hypothetical protein M0805_006755 [Coniferiporia weirii]
MELVKSHPMHTISASGIAQDPLIYRRMMMYEMLQKEEEAKAREIKRTRATSFELGSKEKGEAHPNSINPPPSTSSGPLDLSSTHKPVPHAFSSALDTARFIEDVYQVQYPEGIKGPKPELYTNAKYGIFRYDRDFLLQFMPVCKEKPNNLLPPEAMGLKPLDQSRSTGRGGSGHRDVSGGIGPPMPTAARRASVSLGFGGLNGFGKSASSFVAVGSFSAPNRPSSEVEFGCLSSMSGGLGGVKIASGRPLPIDRSFGQSGSDEVALLPIAKQRTRAKRGKAQDEPYRISSLSSQFNAADSDLLEPVAPLEYSANRWIAYSMTERGTPVDTDSPEVVERKVRSLLNKLTMENFESICSQIIAWANKSETERNGRTLVQIVQLVLKSALDDEKWNEMYARLCRKMMEQISPNVQDDGIRNAEGEPITGGLLFRKCLLNRCQEDFECGWAAKGSTAVAAKAKASESRAVRDANEKDKTKEADEGALYSEEYYAAQKTKRQGFGLVKFLGELFKLQMLTERNMHECIKKLLSNVDNPEEGEIESLCKLLTTVGQSLDTSKARGHMDVYFSRIAGLTKRNDVSLRLQFMLLDVIELRSRGWLARKQVAAPSTLAQIHEAAAKEKIQQEKNSLARSMGMYRGGLRRGHERNGDAQQVGPSVWTNTPGPSRPVSEASDLSNFGKITKGGTMTFGSLSAFNAKRDGSGKRDDAFLFPEFGSLPRHPMPIPKEKQPYSLVRSKINEDKFAEGAAAMKLSMSKEQAEKKIEQDSEDFAPATTPLRIKVDLSAFFRGGSSTKTSSPVTSTFAESIASPPMRSSTLSPAVPPPQSQNAPGPAGPSPHGHAHPHQPPQQQYPPPFVPTFAMRNQNVGGGPRSPSFPRQMPNGAAGRPPVANGPPGANGSNMPSPRLGPPSHQLHPHNQHQPAPVPGMPSQMQPVAWGGGYYYSYLPGMPTVQGVPGQEHYTPYRTMSVPEKEELSSSAQADADEAEEGSAVAKPSMTKEQVEKKIEHDSKEFFANRNLDEAEEYFTPLPVEYQYMFVEELVVHAIVSGKEDAQLVADVFERARARNLCSPASFEDGFVPTVEILDDIVTYAPRAFDLMAIMMKGAKLDEKLQTRIADKYVDSNKQLFSLLA